MYRETPWEFKLNPDSAEKSISEKARELVNKMRLLLGDGDYNRRTRIWYDEGFHDLFYALLDAGDTTILSEINQGRPFDFLKILQQLKSGLK